MERKKRLRLVQLSLIIFGVLIIFFTFSINKKNTVNKIISKDIQNKILESNKELKGSDVFLDIEYSGLDLSGNRYILKAKEAFNNGKKLFDSKSKQNRKADLTEKDIENNI